MVSDRPDPTNSDVVLQFYDLTTKKSTGPEACRDRRRSATRIPTGGPTARSCCTSATAATGRSGAPAIYRWDVATSKGTPLTGPGYLEPSYSPDGRYIAATKTSSFGNDVVILDAVERPRAPAGHQRRRVVGAGLVADRRRDRVPPHRGPDRRPQAGPPRRRRAELDGQGHHAADRGLGLDGESRPDWFVPADQLPAPTPAAEHRAQPARAARRPAP